MTFQQLSPRYVLTRVVFAALIAATVFVSGARTGAAGATAARPAIGLSAAKVTPLDSICVRYGLEPAVDYTLTVTGTGFKPDEKVAIRMTQFGSSVLARARATGTGTFSATFKDPRQPAALGKVRATGSLGSVATHKITTYFAIRVTWSQTRRRGTVWGGRPGRSSTSGSPRKSLPGHGRTGRAPSPPPPTTGAGAPLSWSRSPELRSTRNRSSRAR